MRFMGDYYTAMDRDYNSNVVRDSPLSEVRIRDIGISTPPFGNQLEALKARIFQGASTVELGFTGAGKGSMEGHNTTPEMYGTEEREAMRDLARINRIKLSTHASYSIGPLSGMTQQGFSEDAREKTVREIERAIDFAADTARGGAVVIHTGEFPRAISESDWNKEEGEFKGRFKMFDQESRRASFHLVDSETGKIVSGIEKDQTITLPIWDTDANGKIRWDEDGSPLPRFNAEKGTFDTVQSGWKDIEKLTEQYNERNKTRLSEAQVFNIVSTKARANYQMGFARTYERYYKDALDNKEELKEQLNSLSRMDKVPKEWKLPEWLQNRSDAEKIEYVKDQTRKKLEGADESLKDYRNSSVAAKQQAEEEIRRAERSIPIEDYAIKRTSETIARAAEFAHRKSEMLKKAGHLNEPIYVAPENIFPEQYGAHPQELKRIINDARDKYVEDYKGVYGKEKAREIAEETIKATLDIGHAYTWRKYFQEDPKKNFEENEKDFQSWMFKQIDDLNKNKLIGHVHVSDNFGWEDEHITPGQGRVPIKEFIDRMKKAGMKEVITEAAHQDYKAMLGGWREFGAPMYGDGAAARRWTEVEHSYFGQTRSPYFIFGDYAPNQQEFTLWSQVPLE